LSNGEVSEDSLGTREEKASLHIYSLFKPLIYHCHNATDKVALISCRNILLCETKRFCMALDLQGEILPNMAGLIYQLILINSMQRLAAVWLNVQVNLGVLCLILSECEKS